MRRVSSRLFAVALIAAVCGPVASQLHSATAETSFITSLAVSDQALAGVEKLTEAERTELDRQIALEITLARQGDVVAFAKTFGDRRTPAQMTEAGLHRLSTEERAQLDRFVARAVANRPAPVITRRVAKNNDDAAETITYRPQLHGEVSLTYGTAGHGREFYGGSFTTVLEDPSRRLAIGFTYAEYHGKGLFPFDDCRPLLRRDSFRPDW